MPKYSVLEAVLVDLPDFDHLNDLASKIVQTAASVSNEISDYMKALDSSSFQ